MFPIVAWQKSGVDPVFALDGGVYTASEAVNWTKSLGLFRDFSEINALDTTPAISLDPAFVTALAELGCPHWQPRPRGT